MVVILVVVLAATVFLSPTVARQAVFTRLWFNGILTLLVVNTASCFFSRLRRRAWNLAFAGVVIFHLSFVAMFVGVITNSLFYYKGALRLTEGESIGISDPNAYDEEYWGPFFNHQWMRGTVTLHKLYTQYNAGNRKGRGK